MSTPYVPPEMVVSLTLITLLGTALGSYIYAKNFKTQEAHTGVTIIVIASAAFFIGASMITTVNIFATPKSKEDVYSSKYQTVLIETSPIINVETSVDLNGFTYLSYETKNTSGTPQRVNFEYLEPGDIDDLIKNPKDYAVSRYLSKYKGLKRFVFLPKVSTVLEKK